MENLAITLSRDQSENATKDLGTIRSSLNSLDYMLGPKAHVANNGEGQTDVESLLAGNKLNLRSFATGSVGTVTVTEKQEGRPRWRIEEGQRSEAMPPSLVSETSLSLIHI